MGMVQRDTDLVKHVRDNGKARFAAEAGINQALAGIVQNGFDQGTAGPIDGTLDGASYAVSFSTIGARHLVTSVGTGPSGITRTVYSEIKQTTPDALNYFAGAGNDVKFYSFVAGAIINGDIHANHEVRLISGPLIAFLYFTGKVSASGWVWEGSLHNNAGSIWPPSNWDFLDDRVYINGSSNDSAVVFENQGQITFPTFNYEKYKQAAIASGNYYSGNQEFNGVTLSPGNGIVYVDGNVTFRGVNTLNGGIIANNITCIGKLFQYKTAHNRNVMIAKAGDITIAWKFYTQQALVYAAQDIKSIAVLGFFDPVDIEINGLMLAGRDIAFWDLLTLIKYNYLKTAPVDMLDSNGEAMFQVLSWNE
jgi:hypothetical protein